MSRIKPFWRIVLGFIFLCVVVYNSSMLAFGGSYAGFAVMAAGFITYVIFAIKIPYDDPLRSMRDIIAQQAQQPEQPKNDSQARIDALEAELAKLREQISKDE